MIVGGGAAGLFAAGTAAAQGLSVTLVEKNRDVGRKLAITGKGRCNVTNDSTVREVMDAMTRNGKFLWSALTAFPPSSTMAFFEERGVALKTERGRRVFPASDRAEDIVRALREYCAAGGVRFLHGTVTDIDVDNGRAAGVEGDFGAVAAGNVILCTGGASYPGTGSTGDGYRLAAALGHTVTPIRPSLVPLTSDDPDCAAMQGFAPKNVRVSLFSEEGKLLFRDLGEMLFTHFGVSGPLILSASAHLCLGQKGHILIDLKPALDEDKLDARILRDFARYANRHFENALTDLAPASLIPVLVARSGIPPETKVNAVTREQRRELVALFKAFRVAITGTRPIAEAIVTSGGVSVAEIDPKTMMSRLMPGLYFAGELIDVDAYTGGFNLQIAWSTAYAAATHLVKA